MGRSVVFWSRVNLSIDPVYPPSISSDEMKALLLKIELPLFVALKRAAKIDARNITSACRIAIADYIAKVEKGKK